MTELHVATRFERLAQATPSAVALVAAGRRLTYSELDTAADRVAAYLAGLGVGGGDFVGVCLERSIEAIVALLAVAKCGAAYVPLDAQYPAARLAYMVDATAAKAILSTEVLRYRLDLPGDRTVHIGEALAGRPSPLGRPRSGDDPLYAMFTSGSTGSPKAVVVRHRNVVNLAVHADYVSLGPAETLLQLAPMSFDAATFEMWGALLTGARLAVAPGGLLDSDRIGDAVAELGVTTLWLTAALFHRMVDENVAGLAPLRQLLTGGDVVASAHVRRALAAHPGLRLVNGYGPTETTTFACCHVMTDPAAVESPVPVGRPLRNVRVHVVGRDGSEVADGAQGELWIAGAGVTMGYLGQPSLTAERFVAEPGGRAGDLAYRTGDLARRRPDGVVEFLGRIDDQVKVRGHRIEPAEIEACLVRQAHVRRAVVTARQAPGGDKRLVAYVVMDDTELDATALRRRMAAELPRHMIPALFVPIPAVPITSNGKTDRNALPDPVWSRPRGGRDGC